MDFIHIRILDEIKDGRDYSLISIFRTSIIFWYSEFYQETRDSFFFSLRVSLSLFKFYGGRDVTLNWHTYLGFASKSQGTDRSGS